MTPGRKTPTNLHYVPWDGNIETHIDERRASQLLAAPSPEGDKVLTEQYTSMQDAGVQGLRYAMEAKGGVIVYCDNPQEAYDAIYGARSQSEKAELKAIIVPFAPVAKNANGLSSIFGLEANGNLHHAPKMNFAFDRAARVPGISGLDLDMPALAA